MPAVDGFSWGRKKPIPVLIVEVNLPLVEINRCYWDLQELHYDHANRVNFRAGLTFDIDATYATALMGGEPYSNWN